MTPKVRKTIDFVIILIVFALTGSTVAYLSGIIMHGIGAQPWTLGYVIGYIFLIFPLYQILILVYGAVFGKFRFFYDRQKKIIQKIGAGFKRIINI